MNIIAKQYNSLKGFLWLDKSLPIIAYKEISLF